MIVAVVMMMTAMKMTGMIMNGAARTVTALKFAATGTIGTVLGTVASSSGSETVPSWGELSSLGELGTSASFDWKLDNICLGFVPSSWYEKYTFGITITTSAFTRAFTGVLSISGFHGIKNILK